MDKKVTQKRNQEKYQELAKQHQPKPSLSKNLLLAFLVGGLISAIAQGVFNLYRAMGVPKPDSGGANGGDHDLYRRAADGPGGL